MNEQAIIHIIERIKKGDYNAFAMLVDDYKDMVYALCFKMTRSQEDAEEIAQDAFVKAFQGIKRFQGKSKFSTWLYQITYFTAINFLRKHKIETVDLESHEASTEDESTFLDLQRKEQKKYIDQALAYLTPVERALVTLYYLEENSVEEISKITSLTQSNVKVKIHRTRKKLYTIMRNLLKNELNSLV